MLYDPKWEKAETKKKRKVRNPLNLKFADFIEWLETQDPHTSYDWYSTQHCVVGQYLTARTGDKFPGGLLVYDQLFGGWDYRKIAGKKPHTFGAALKRARAVS